MPAAGCANGGNRRSTPVRPNRETLSLATGSTLRYLRCGVLVRWKLTIVEKVIKAD
ncbi:hypothetical protein [Nostoc sp.]|uniref:hypothetical protein n=1 Tax=Nostoc sp. TaxID=1180 RepID=UPI002FF9A179